MKSGFEIQSLRSNGLGKNKYASPSQYYAHTLKKNFASVCMDTVSKVTELVHA